ncbi:MAG: EAL domain-containing protein [Aestuariivirga sp.]|uniref:EAL domain-containing protein n=1 Tax=Aestuariivirga sp. TaxID=2650926 RepID=UPI0025C6450F|nr:EAL domain-containing protein [Aestuariivirga sp.]MCA3560773.1 EAL domain-containing protein [Aestuariivirga sp.]
MSRHMAPVMLGLTAFPLAAIGIAAYLVGSAGPQSMAVAGAILLLSCCILLAVTVAVVKLQRHDEWLWSQQDSLRELAAKSEDLATRLESVEQAHADTGTTAQLAAVARDMKMLRRELHDYAGAQPAWRHFGPEAEPAAAGPQPQWRPYGEVAEPPAAAAPPPKPAKAAGREELTLLLEPVVELASGSTSHYRTMVGLTDSSGKPIGHDDLILKADQGGMRPALDLRMVKMVAPVLRRLRNRNPGLRIFVPVGKETLGAPLEAAKILALLQKDGDVAQGIVFEFAQQDLGALDAAGIENLAKLARNGATLALREVYLGGLDLTALRQLGVRFLSFPPHAVDAGNGPNAAWADFVKQANARQIQVIVGGVKTPQQAAAAGRAARFGHGPFFAPPRKVKPDAGIAAPAARTANAA